MLTLTEQDADRSIAVTVGDQVAVTLAENRTAGYQWSIDAASGGVSVVSSEFDAAPDGRPGAAGRRRIVLRAASPGGAELRLRYQRPWETDSGSGRQCRFVFAIKSA